MVWCSISSQLNTGLVLTAKYKNYKYYSQLDTTKKITLYSFENNYNSKPGYLIVSSSIVYDNEGVNHSQPYIEVYGDTIRNGFIESSSVSGGTGMFNADTMIMNFTVKPSAGNPYSMKCKYKKQ